MQQLLAPHTMATRSEGTASPFVPASPPPAQKQWDATLYDGQWTADYVRLRLAALRD
ncbi:MAG: hypothetical protein HY316_04675 [Acidobacteria bacterium]|nr:hypothetical protein [Acidobacteriota bacterium]